MAKVFISYARSDYIGGDGKVIPDNIIDKVCRALHDNGISFWIDRQGLDGGITYPEVMASEIKACDVFLFLASENSNRSKWTLREISWAIHNYKKILPVRLDSSPYADSVALYLSSIQYIDWLEDGEEKALARIVDSIKSEKVPQNEPAPVNTGSARLPVATMLAISVGLVFLTGVYAFLTYQFLWADSLRNSPILGGLVGYVCEMGILLSIYYLIRMLRMRRCVFILPGVITLITLFAGLSPKLLPKVIPSVVSGRPDKDLLWVSIALLAGWVFILLCCLFFRKKGGERKKGEKRKKGKNFFGLMNRYNVLIKASDPENLIWVYLVFKAFILLLQPPPAQGFLPPLFF